jgi:hypothetical protein
MQPAWRACRHYWRPDAGDGRSNTEVVDWNRLDADVVTEQALTVLAAQDRRADSDRGTYSGRRRLAEGGERPVCHVACRGGDYRPCGPTVWADAGGG